ncbi:porin [Burkholderia pseudomallei]|uniref:porin n=1 Tax=Burkholderia pseudomallei TaxID=28450 RepID=UPI00052A67D4|nr:porin [Burkholderia pseudomallei]AIV62699.1 gram-negative porin family protein [Burkholderia pseudomallei K42]
MKKSIVACLPIFVTTGAFAQSSVTLYGLIDEGIGFTNNSGGHQAWQMQSGWVAGDRWGIKGREDLGGGTRAVFTLESGFDLNSGSLGQAHRMFGRQAFVGLHDDRLGTLTLGRQYDSVVDYLAPLTANGGWAGWPFAHPYDNDNTDDSFRLNNTLKYSSVEYDGVRFGGAYAFGNQAGGFSSNRAYSLGASYTGSALSAAIAFLQESNPGASANGALSADDTNFVAQRQRVWGGGVNYTWQAATVGFVYTHTSLDSPRASVYFGALPAGVSSIKFDNFELNARYQFAPTLWALAMYTFTEGRANTAAGESKPKWHQGGLMVDYLLSKRTDVYVQAVYQHVTGGSSINVFNTAYISGAAGLSSSKSQFYARLGIKHTF